MNHCTNLSTELTPVRVSGSDAERFLQAQLTCDTAALVSSNDQQPPIIHAAWCNPKGRVISTFYVTLRDGDHWLVLPANHADKVLTRLRMFVMRASVTFTTDSDWHVSGRIVTSAAPACESCQQVQWLRLPHSQREIAILAGSEQLKTDHCDDHIDLWRHQRICDGEAYIDLQTTETMLPEHLNLDLNGAVSFTKGCFPGQEVVARMHYKGKQKTRLFCASVNSNVAVAGGHSVTDADQKTVGSIVESVVADGTLTATLTAPTDSMSADARDVYLAAIESSDGVATDNLKLAKPGYWTD